MMVVFGLVHEFEWSRLLLLVVLCYCYYLLISLVLLSTYKSLYSLSSFFFRRFFLFNPFWWCGRKQIGVDKSSSRRRLFFLLFCIVFAIFSSFFFCSDLFADFSFSLNEKKWESRKLEREKTDTTTTTIYINVEGKLEAPNASPFLPPLFSLAALGSLFLYHTTFCIILGSLSFLLYFELSSTKNTIKIGPGTGP